MFCAFGKLKFMIYLPSPLLWGHKIRQQILFPFRYNKKYKWSPSHPWNLQKLNKILMYIKYYMFYKFGSLLDRWKVEIILFVVLSIKHVVILHLTLVTMCLHIDLVSLNVRYIISVQKRCKVQVNKKQFILVTIPIYAMSVF